jgi:ABC-2 type transport system permease protein
LKSLVRIYAVSSKEVRQLYRDRLSFGMIVGVPLLLILLFGYAINLDVRNLKAAVADHSNTQLSRRLISDMEATQIIRVTRGARDAAGLKDLLDAGVIEVGVYIPADFERRLTDGRRSAVQILVDGSDPTIARVAGGFSAMPVPERAGRRTAEAPLFATRTYYNPENRSAVFIVPAISGVILQLTMVLFTAIAIVRERERGNLELLISTPIRKTELMAGKILPYILIGLIQASIIFITGFLLFDVVVQGSVTDLYLAALLFISAVLALGLVVSTIARNQFQAMQMTMLTLLPSIFLSGYMFPFEGMPEAAQWIGRLLPLTHYIDLVRGIVLRGEPLGGLAAQVQALSAFFVIFLLLAIRRFKKQLD